jgi:hypothetical protein
VNQVEWARAGRQVACGGCGKAVTVPVPMETIGPTPVPAPAQVLRFVCPACGRKYATKPQLAGRKIRCGRCGAGVRVPSEAGSAPALPAQLADDIPEPFEVEPAPTRPARAPAPVDRAAARADSDEPESMPLFDDIESMPGMKRRKRAEAVLPSRAEAMEQVRQRVAEQEAVEAETKARKAKRKKKKSRAGAFDPKEVLTLVGGVGAFVAVLAFLAWGYPDLRFPLGGLLCVIGFIVYLLGAFSLRQLAAEEGAMQAVLFRFFPPYQWYFVATHWAEARDFVAFFAAGFVILTIGGAIIKTSEIGRKAEESERAYQQVHEGGLEEMPPPALPGPGEGN